MNVKLGPEYLDNDTILIKFLFNQSSFEGQTRTNLRGVPKKEKALALQVLFLGFIYYKIPW